MPGLRKAVVINGIEYKSIRQASLALNIPWSTVKHRMSKGRDPDVKYQSISCCGQYSIREYCRQTGVKEKNVYNFIESRRTLALGMHDYARYNITKIFQKLTKKGEVTIKSRTGTRSCVMYIMLNDKRVAEFYRNKFRYEGKLYLLSFIEFANILCRFKIDYYYIMAGAIYTNIESELKKKFCEKTQKSIIKY